MSPPPQIWSSGARLLLRWLRRRRRRRRVPRGRGRRSSPSSHARDGTSGGSPALSSSPHASAQDGAPLCSPQALKYALYESVLRLGCSALFADVHVNWSDSPFGYLIRDTDLEAACKCSPRRLPLFPTGPTVHLATSAEIPTSRPPRSPMASCALGASSPSMTPRWDGLGLLMASESL
jgi:hypothetical protein